MGDQAKFKQREDLMAKSRAKGDTKIAGASLNDIPFVTFCRFNDIPSKNIERTVIHLFLLSDNKPCQH